MTDFQPIKTKSFWERPEGVTGGIFMAALVLGGGYLLYQILPYSLNLQKIPSI
jgi:hypothetical protein